MFSKTGAIALFILALWAGLLPANEPALLPQQGLLLLRNGHVMQGGITRAGDFYVLTLGTTGEVRLPASDVETQCVDLEDAYNYQVATMGRKTADAHLRLAEWCLRNNMRGKAAEQLLNTLALDAKHPGIDNFQRRLDAAENATVSHPVGTSGPAETVGAEQLDKILQELPKGSLERFSGVVQPILLNRCAANGCHGPAAKSEFRLLRPPAGQVMTKRFTQRNLYAVLKYIDRDAPENSRLLMLPQERHGSTLAPVFDKRNMTQFDDLARWANASFAKAPVAVPSTIAEKEPLLSQARDAGGLASGNTPKRIAPMNTGVQDSVPAGKPTEASKPRESLRPREENPAAPGSAFVPRDPFDPEIFNRLHPR